MDGLIGVTGATGIMGGRVAALLAECGVAQRLVVRDVGRAPRVWGT
jgi:NAD(P)H dehydrogenase (quinone)